MTASIALKENQSTAAEFNVNLVTAFSVIVREPKDDNNANVVKDVVKGVVKELADRQQVILELLSLDPTMTARAISEKISEKTSEKFTQ